MKLTNCTWEKTNLDKRVAEISFDGADVIDLESMRQLEKEYDYLVAKVQPCSYVQYRTLQELGYYFVESQITVRNQAPMSVKNINFIVPSQSLNTYMSIECKRANSNESIERLLANMTVGMFTTDRIYLDPAFGKEYSLRRYRNWIYQEYCRGSNIYNIIYQGEEIGFIIYRVENDCIHVLLWGLFESHQRKGLGSIVPLSAYWIGENVETFTNLETKVSSNNKGIILKLCQLGFDLSEMEYVFVKHIC